MQSLRRSSLVALGLCMAAFGLWQVQPRAASAQVSPFRGRTDPVPLSMGSPAGARVFRPGSWSQVGIEIANPTNQPTTVSATFHFSSAPDFHFRRDLWLPPKSKRLANCPVLTPDLDEQEAREQNVSDRSFEMNCVVTIESPEGTRTLTDMGGALKRTTFLPRNQEPLVSALFPDDREMPATAYATPYEMLIAARIAAGRTRRTGEFSRPLYPDSLQQLDSIDQIMLHSNVAFSHPATVSALRDWLLAGGRLWIMLDRVDEANVQWLLGDDYQCAVIDQVDLTQIQFGSVMFGDVPAQTTTYERPVPMTRVETAGVEVAYTVDGWPAAFFQSFGHGRVLFTTVGPEGWVRLYQNNDPRPGDPNRQAAFVALPALEDLSGTLFMPTPSLPLNQAEWQPYLTERIGYRIVSRWPVLAVLGLFVAVLASGGTYLRRRHSPHAAWFAPMLAVLAAVPIGLMGLLKQREVPPMAAVAQNVVLNPSTPWLHVAGSMSLYQQEPGELPISSQSGGYLLPDRQGLQGTTREIAWQDSGHWTWDRLRLPAGVRNARFSIGQTLPEPIRMETTFGPRGVEGRLAGVPVEKMEDALILVPNSYGLAVRMDADGRFTGDVSDSLARGVFTNEVVLSDEQRRRQSLLATMYARRQQTLFPPEPTLMFWSPPVDTGLLMPESLTITGSALLTAPVRLSRPAAGTDVTIPSSFLPFRCVAGPTGRGVASSYQASTGEWVKMTLPSDTWLRIQVPPVLLPVELERLDIRLQMNAPSRTMRLAAVRGTDVITLLETENPSGVIQYTIDDPTLLALDETGGLMLALIVTEASSKERRSAEWIVQDLQLTLKGRVP